MTTYLAVEIFHSVHGEAYHAGIPHVFLPDLEIVTCDVNGATLTF